MLDEPVVFAAKASEPTAVFVAPVVFNFKDSLPSAVLLDPSVFVVPAV